MNLHFLAGVPRSGSTLLAAILRQHPQVHVSTTSGLVLALDGLANTWHRAPILARNDPTHSRLAASMGGLIRGYYGEIEKPVVIDKSRGWPVPVVMHSMQSVLGRAPRIVATVRSIPDCMASFVRLANPPDLDAFMERGEFVDHIKAAYQSLRAGFDYDPSAFLIVEYDDLMANPRRELSRVHEFLGLDPFNHDLDAIDGSAVKEDDEGLHHLPGLHDIRPKLARADVPHAREVLRHHYAQFCQPEFWLKEPRTRPELDLLDVQLAAAKVGDFTEGRRIADELARTRPNDSRAAFNRGFYELRDGNLMLGHSLLYQGRRVRVFGDGPLATDRPLWQRERNKTVLLKLEGGLGDQIQQMRHVEDLRYRSNAAVISCAAELVPIARLLKNVAQVVPHGMEAAADWDCWIPAMSAPLFLRLHYDDISGAPYLPRNGNPSGPLTVGLRWSGNKRFEHEHHKLFPPAPFFDAVKRDGVRFISLQRDADLEHKPEWVETVPLETWQDTRAAVSMCDLVVSSCTSVSHLAAAMGIPTAIVIPVMPYYLYALPGDRTPYYHSVRLLRQTTFGDWSEPMRNLQQLVSEFERGAQL